MIGVAELRFFHYAVYPLALLLITRVWFGPFRRLSFVNCFVIGWLLLIHAQAAEIFLYDYRSALFLFSVWLTPVLVLLAAKVAQLSLRGQANEPPAEVEATQAGQGWDRVAQRVAPFFTLGVFALIALYIVDIGPRNVAFFFIVARPGSALDAMLLRITGLQSHISPVLTVVYSYGRALVLPVYAAVITALHFSGRLSRLHWVTGVVAAGLFSVLTAAKAPLAVTLLGVLVAAYLTRAGKLRLGRVVFGFGLALFLPALVYPLLTGARGLDALGVAATNLWRRATYVTSVTGAMYFDAFPAIRPFAGAGSNRLLALGANVPFHDTSEWVFDRFLGGGVQGGTANSAFFAAFYADWGMAGVVLGAVLVGVLLAGLQRFFEQRRSRDAITVGVWATTLVAAIQLMMTNFYSCALGRGMISLPILLALGDVLSRRRSDPAARHLSPEVS